MPNQIAEQQKRKKRKNNDKDEKGAMT